MPDYNASLNIPNIVIQIYFFSSCSFVHPMFYHGELHNFCPISGIKWHDIMKFADHSL